MVTVSDLERAMAEENDARRALMTSTSKATHERYDTAARKVERACEQAYVEFEAAQLEPRRKTLAKNIEKLKTWPGAIGPRVDEIVAHVTAIKELIASLHTTSDEYTVLSGEVKTEARALARLSPLRPVMIASGS